MGKTIAKPFTRAGAAAMGISQMFKNIIMVALLGDSLTAFGRVVSGNTKQWTCVGHHNWLRRILRDRALFDHSLLFAVAGQGSDHLLTVQVPQAIASGAKLAIVRIGTNDIGVLTAAQIIFNVTLAVARLNAAGIAVVLVSIVPQSAWQVGKRQQATEVNRAYAKLASSALACRFVDLNPVYTDYSTGNALAGMQFSDGVHSCAQGSLTEAKRIYPVLDDILPKTPDILPMTDVADWDATLAPNGNLIANPIFKGTGGTLSVNGSAAAPTGNLAASWHGRFATNTATTMTAAFSKGTETENSTIPTQIITLGGTADGNILRMVGTSDGVNRYITPPTPLTPGSLWVFEMLISWTGLANITNLILQLNMSDGTTTYTSEDNSLFNAPGTTAIALPAAFEGGLFRTPPLAVPVAGLSATGLVPELRISGPNGAAGGVITCSRASLHPA